MLDTNDKTNKFNMDNLWTWEEMLESIEQLNRELDEMKKHSTTSELKKSTGFPFI